MKTIENEITLTPKEMEAAFAYAISFLSPDGVFVINNALNKFWYRIIHNAPFKEMQKPERFTMNQLREIISKEAFEKIPEIKVLTKEIGLSQNNISLDELARKTIEIILKDKLTHIEYE